MKNQIQLSHEMILKLLNLAKDEIDLPETPLGAISIKLKKLKLEANQISVPVQITALSAYELLLSFKLENGFELTLDSLSPQLTGKAEPD